MNTPTPGPWKHNALSEPYFGHDTGRDMLACAVWTADEQHFICSTRWAYNPKAKYAPDDATADANARLIAAAPVLLAIAKEVLEVFDGLGYKWFPETGYPREISNLLPPLRAAIDEAERR